MPKYEHRVYRVQVEWDGDDYYLAAMIQRDDWTNVDHLGEKGWEFVAFVPNHEEYIDGSFTKEQLKYVRLAVFKRLMGDNEEMNFGIDRPS